MPAVHTAHQTALASRNGNADTTVLREPRRRQCGYHESARRLAVPQASHSPARTVRQETRGSRRTLRTGLWRPIILGDKNVWSDTWSADAARNGDIPYPSRWPGIDVYRFSEPVLGTARVTFDSALATACWRRALAAVPDSFGTCFEVPFR